MAGIIRQTLLHGNATVSGEVEEGRLESLVSAGRERQISAKRSMDGDLEEGVPRPHSPYSGGVSDNKIWPIGMSSPLK
jgi:hypothetical protein